MYVYLLWGYFVHDADSEVLGIFVNEDIAELYRDSGDHPSYDGYEIEKFELM
jgi:hypothetical protein